MVCTVATRVQQLWNAVLDVLYLLTKLINVNFVHDEVKRNLNSEKLVISQFENCYLSAYLPKCWKSGCPTKQ